MYRNCVVVPVSFFVCLLYLYRGTVLTALHAAHQGVSAMERRAKVTIFWPGMTQDINNIRNSCVHCNRNASSQAAIPLRSSTRPQRHLSTFLRIILITVGAIFLVIGDKFSGWEDVFGT